MLAASATAAASASGTSRSAAASPGVCSRETCQNASAPKPAKISERTIRAGRCARSGSTGDPIRDERRELSGEVVVATDDDHLDSAAAERRDARGETILATVP